MSTNSPQGEMPQMSDYGVGPDWSALPWAWAGVRLDATRNYWVTTVSPGGQPHSLPVWGVWSDDELRFMFSCSPRARKARNLAANPLVTFTNADTVEAVSVQGVAHVLTAAARIDSWVERYVAKYRDEVGDDFEEFLRQNAMIEVVPVVAFGMIERADEFATRATRWRFSD
ncbi:MAG: pyridoxamine 5'-phosphate oxidase family protein [Actinomycetota bacterium]